MLHFFNIIQNKNIIDDILFEIYKIVINKTLYNLKYFYEDLDVNQSNNNINKKPKSNLMFSTSEIKVENSYK